MGSPFRPKHPAKAMMVPLVVAAGLTLAPACASRQPSALPRETLAPPAWLASVPATHDPLSAVLGAYEAIGPGSSRDGVRQDIFADYLTALAEFGPLSAPELFPADAQKLAYFVDAHIAWTIALGEARRFRRLDVDGLRRVPFPLDRGSSTLAALEAEVARRAPWEPRLALLLNPGWKGGPPLPPSALEGYSLDWQLANHAALCGSTTGFWALNRGARTVMVSAFTDAMWGLPREQPARARRLLDLVPPPAQLRHDVVEVCGPSLQRCRIASTDLDRARLFEPAARR